MADTQREIMKALLRSLLDREVIAKSTYDKAVDLVHSTIDFPDFFGYPVCCQKEGEMNGCTQG